MVKQIFLKWIFSKHIILNFFDYIIIKKNAFIIDVFSIKVCDLLQGSGLTLSSSEWFFIFSILLQYLFHQLFDFDFRFRLRRGLLRFIFALLINIIAIFFLWNFVFEITCNVKLDNIIFIFFYVLNTLSIYNIIFSFVDLCEI